MIPLDPGSLFLLAAARATPALPPQQAALPRAGPHITPNPGAARAPARPQREPAEIQRCRWNVIPLLSLQPPQEFLRSGELDKAGSTASTQGLRDFGKVFVHKGHLGIIVLPWQRGYSSTIPGQCCRGEGRAFLGIQEKKIDLDKINFILKICPIN